MLSISGSSCSLCQAYLGKKAMTAPVLRARCASSATVGPATAGAASITRRPNPHPRGHVDDYRDPEPMIEWLEKTLRYVQEKGRSSRA